MSVFVSLSLMLCLSQVHPAITARRPRVLLCPRLTTTTRRQLTLWTAVVMAVGAPHRATCPPLCLLTGRPPRSQCNSRRVGLLTAVCRSRHGQLLSHTSVSSSHVFIHLHMSPSLSGPYFSAVSAAHTLSLFGWNLNWFKKSFMISFVALWRFIKSVSNE